MIGFYNYTVILTYIGFISSFVGMYFSVIGNSNSAIFCLMIAGFCDMFDGKIAKTKKNRTRDEKKFGIQIDSLSDLLCFGVLPIFIGYSIGMNEWYYFPILVLFPLAALIRLAYFNVIEEERTKQTEDDLKYCLGLPVTPVAIILPIIYLLKNYVGSCFSAIYALALLIISILFLTKFKIKKFDLKKLLVLLVIGIGIIVFISITK